MQAVAHVNASAQADTRAGAWLQAFGALGLGALSLRYSDFALQWQPVPQWVPWRAGLADLSGALLIACGVGLLVSRLAKAACATLTVYIFCWVVLLQAPKVIAGPLDIGNWLGLCENLALATGLWILLCRLTPGTGRLTTPQAERTALVLFAVCLPVFGLSHLMYAQFTANMIPTWIPLRLALAWLTGIAHIAAGVGLLTRLLPRLAVTLEAVMMSLFVLLVHVSGIITEPGSRLQWTMLFVAAALSGAAWTVAGSLSATPLWIAGPVAKPDGSAPSASL